MLRSAELNTLSMTNTIQRNLVYVSPTGENIDKVVGRRGDMMEKHHAWVSKLLPGYTGFGDQFKNDEQSIAPNLWITI